MSFSHPALPWLLEEDNPTVRCLALKELMGAPDSDHKLRAAKKEAYAKGPIAEILEHMEPEGYWQKPGAGYGPKYTGTVWSLILLSQLGASAHDDTRIEKACTYYLDHAVSKEGSISYNGTPSGTIDCLSGNMCTALLRLGYHDERLSHAFDWMARSVVGDNITYYCYKCGPNFACGPNGKKACAWGAVKVMLAFGQLAPAGRTPVIKKAIKQGAEFLLGVDPLTADYPTADNIKPSGNWWKFGFPVFYVTDVLQLTEALVNVGYGNDPRLKRTIEYIKSKQDAQGRWELEYDYKGKTRGIYGRKGQPNKWVTYRALKVFKALNKTI